jgi:rhodanese-related sulfurtransferase
MKFFGGRKMDKKLSKLSILIGTLVILSGSSAGLSVNVLTARNEEIFNNFFYKSDVSINNYIDINPEEAWDFLTDTSNGIQIPIDVRGTSEWLTERIDTPFPEDPKRHSDFSSLGLQEFISLYNGSEIILYCRSGGRSSSAANILDDSDFYGVIYNMAGGITQWKEDGLPTKFFNHAPDQPETPVGPTVGTIDVSYTFSTSTIDSDDDSVRYGWSFDGDNVVDEWTPYHASGTVAEISHNWSASGTYYISVVAEDNVGEQSIFSENLTIMIKNPPNPPIIEGETEGAYDEEYEYTFNSFDPDGDDIYLYIEWGDGSIEDYIGPYQSEEEVILKHTYAEEDTYIIRAKAKDTDDFESDWSTLEVIMPKNCEINSRFLTILKSLFYFFN